MKLPRSFAGFSANRRRFPRRNSGSDKRVIAETVVTPIPGLNLARKRVDEVAYPCFMSIESPKFLAALVLLLTPLPLFHGQKARYRSIETDWGDHWTRMLAFWLHTVDFLRA